MREAVPTPPFCISTNYQVCVECSYYASVVLLLNSVIYFVVQIYSCLFDCHHFLDQVAWETNTETEICLEDVYCGVSSRSIFKGDYRKRAGEEERFNLCYSHNKGLRQPGRGVLCAAGIVLHNGHC